MHNLLGWFEEAIKITPESKYVDSNGAKIHYLVWGETTKPGLFLIHGYRPCYVLNID